MISNYNFELVKAAHAKQAAYNEMAKVQSEMSALSKEISDRTAEIDERQTELNELKSQTDKEWKSYNDYQLSLKAKIGDVITSIKECNALSENFKLMSEDKSEEQAKASIYAEGADFFSRLASQKMIERDQLITKKRSAIRPDNNGRAAQLIENLKRLRKERASRLNDYHALKSELSLKKTNFDRLNNHYNAIKNGIEEESDYTFRPITLDNSLNKRLLLDANIPEEYHKTCTIKQRSDGKIDIYYGGSLEMEHGHTILENSKVVFSRKPEPKSITL